MKKDFCTWFDTTCSILGTYYHERMFTALQILGLLVMHLASRTHVLFIQKLILIVIRRWWLGQLRIFACTHWQKNQFRICHIYVWECWPVSAFGQGLIWKIISTREQWVIYHLESAPRQSRPTWWWRVNQKLFNNLQTAVFLKGQRSQRPDQRKRHTNIS